MKREKKRYIVCGFVNLDYVQCRSEEHTSELKLPYTKLFLSVLIDKTKSGKIRPWREKKMANVDYFELLHILEFKKAERVKDCAEVLEYKVSYETGEKTLYRVWFCKSRLCPM